MLKVKIIKEVHSEKQRKYFCASEDPELNAMCDDPMKEEQLEEMSAMSAGAVSGPAGRATEEDEEPLEELYSSKGSMVTGRQRPPSDGDDPEGSLEWGRARGLQNFKVRSENVFHDKWRDFLKS